MKIYWDSFIWAWQGISYAFRNEKHMKVHGIMAILAILAGFLLKISTTEFLLVLVAISLVISMELLNTAIESMVDMITAEFMPLAKIAKDVGAGAVLVAAAMAVIIGLVVFLPKILVFF